MLQKIIDASQIGTSNSQVIEDLKIDLERIDLLDSPEDAEAVRITAMPGLFSDSNPASIRYKIEWGYNSDSGFQTIGEPFTAISSCLF